MIGNIDIEKTLQLRPNKECLFVSVATILNHVVDVVNELQKQIDKVSCAILDLATPDGANKALKSIQAEPVDPYAEQRRWIGKLCRFRNNPACEWEYGILYRIYEDTDFPFWDTDCYEYAECEPVKPDDDIIYKGE